MFHFIIMVDYQKKQADMKMGLRQEDNFLSILNEKFPNTKKTTGMFSLFDWRNEDLKIDFEMKSRRNTKDKYPSTFFGECKLIEGRKNLKDGISKRIIYIFNFVDKNNSFKRDYWYWEDDGREMEIIQAGNLKRNDILKSTVNLNVDLLKPLSELW